MIIPPEYPRFDQLGRPLSPEILYANFPSVAPTYEAVAAPPAAPPQINAEAAGPIAPFPGAAPSVPTISEISQLPPARAPLVIGPVPEGPQERRLREWSEGMPTPAQFPQTRLRRVLNAIAGGFAGAAGGPLAGVQVGEALRYGPYHKAMESWLAKGKALEPTVKAEEERMKVGVDVANALRAFNVGEAQIQNYLSQIGYRKEQADIAKKREERETKSAADLKAYHEGLLKIQQGRLNKKSDLEKQLAMLDDPDSRKKLEDYWKIRHEGTGRLSLAEEIARVGALTEKRLSVEDVAKERVAGREVEEIKKRYESQIGSPTEPGLTPYEMAGRVIATDEFLKDPDNKKLAGHAGILPPTADQVKVLSVNRTALEHINTVVGLASDPFIQRNLGPLIGRINLAKARIGVPGEKIPEGAIVGRNVGKTAQEKDKEQEFLSMLVYLVAWEAKQIAGARPSIFITRMIEAATPRAYMGIDQLLGAARASEGSANNQIRAYIPGARRGGLPNLPSVLSPRAEQAPRGKVIGFEEDK